YRAGPGALAPAGAAGAPQRSAPAALPAPSFEALPAPQLELHAQAMLKAMIAAAKSDGHMDDRERELVGSELDRLQADPATRQWVEAEIRRPVDPQDVARAAGTPELAAEVYLASVLVVDDTTAMERAYLDQLAQALRLAPQLKADLEARAAAAG
ncbi:MAG: tellurite resistance TerB family protein, partial [Pseudomonadota bacterium]